jgi:hypothetical protein
MSKWSAKHSGFLKYKNPAGWGFSPGQTDPIRWLMISKAGNIVIGVVGLVVVYYVLKKILPVAGGLVTGNNVITQNQTDAQGNTVDAYQGAGVLGTLGAGANSASGGWLASLGESIGGWLAPSYDPNAPLSGTNRNQVVTPNYVTDVSDLKAGSDGSWD